MLYCSGEAGQPDRCAFARSVVISFDSVSPNCSSFTGRYLNIPGENAFFSQRQLVSVLLCNICSTISSQQWNWLICILKMLSRNLMISLPFFFSCFFFNHSSSVWYQKSKSRWLLSVCFSLSLENNLMESFLKQIMERVCCGLYCLCSPASICFQRMLKHLLSRFKISIFQLRTTKSWRFLPYYFQNIDTPSEIPFLLLFWDPGSACRVGGTSPCFCVSVSESTRWSGLSDPNKAATYVYLNPAFPSLGPITTEFYSEVKEECWVMEASKLSRSAIQLATSHGNILIYVLKINFLR